jgi:hypothetical protein
MYKLCVLYSMNQQVIGMMGGLGGLNRFLSELIKVQITSLAPAIFSDPSMQNCRAIAVKKKVEEGMLAGEKRALWLTVQIYLGIIRFLYFIPGLDLQGSS